MILTAQANAKINLTLDILGKREDGYHLVDMIMQSVSLFDKVTIELCSEGISVLSSNNTLGGEDDICHKAARLFYEKSGVEGGVSIKVEKQIPLAAGLGGGSADAAAVLLLLNKAYGDILPFDTLEEIALSLGADVPFFLNGGTVRVGGIGEVFTPLPNCPECYIVIAKSGQKASTKEMYAVIDSKPVSCRPDNEAAVEALGNGDINKLCANMKNVFSVAWQNNAAYDVLIKHSPLAVSLSGSGPSYFGVYENSANANAAISELEAAGIPAFLTIPLKKAIKIV